ncbi:MAG: hypothetical protein ACPHUL_00090 [Marinomonas gallaica]
MAFVTGTATFTSGQQAVTSVTLNSGTLAFFASGTSVAVGADPVVDIAEAISSDSGTFTLRNPWGNATGTYSFTAWNTVEGLRDAVQSARGFADTLQEALDNLGTAAEMDVQTSPTDATLGRILKNGSWGLGSFLAPETPSSDLAEPTPSGFYRISNAVVFDGDHLDQASGSTAISIQWDNDNFTRLMLDGGGSSSSSPPEMVMLNKNFGTLKEPIKMLSDGNVIYSRHALAGTFNSNAVISGANLNPARIGSWRNISSRDLGSGDYGLWRKV